jgi:iron(II)-dependent oxidoreductase
LLKYDDLPRQARDKHIQGKLLNTKRIAFLTPAGNVWQLTSSFTDSHTRRVVLKGGSNYRPTYKPGVPAFNLNKADFYYPQARNLVEHNIAFLMSDSFERAGTVGFRCVRDV